MHDVDHRFAIIADSNGEIRVALGHAFTDADCAALVAATNAAIRAVAADAR